MNITLFISNEVIIRPVAIDKVDSFIEKHVGELLQPPESKERYLQLGQFTSHEFSVNK